MSTYPPPDFCVTGNGPLVLTGSSVGVLDHTQSSRILNSPTSSLSFATFHPYAGSAASSTACCLLPSCSGRIIVETLSDGSSVWRPIPLAVGASSLSDEGSWPRLINICGYVSSKHLCCVNLFLTHKPRYLVNCSLEQWEIHKLDEAYTCSVSREDIPMITIKQDDETDPKGNTS